MSKPALIAEAEVVEALAVRYNRLPSEVAESDVYNLRHVTLLGMLAPAQEP